MSTITAHIWRSTSIFCEALYMIYRFVHIRYSILKFSLVRKLKIHLQPFLPIDSYLLTPFVQSCISYYSYTTEKENNDKKQQKKSVYLNTERVFLNYGIHFQGLQYASTQITFAQGTSVAKYELSSIKTWRFVPNFTINKGILTKVYSSF